MYMANIITAVAVVWSLIQIYWAVFGFFNVMISRPIHVAFGLALTFLLYSIKGSKKNIEDFQDNKSILNYVDIGLALLSLATAVYMVINVERITSRIAFVDEVFLGDIVIGVILVVLILEAGRRCLGLALPLLAGVFLLYQFFGQHLPNLLRHGGISIQQFIDMNLLSATGIYSTPVAVAADTVFYFLIFAAFLDISGGGQFFIDIATKLAGKFRGGPAKVAVVASGLMGMINGSAVGNVAGTGAFTIPLMKKTGYSPKFAGAVEAVASTGGQIMPPIMGAAAFVMAQFVGIPYFEVAKAAAIPALLFYIALFIAVDIKAKEENILGIGKEQLKELAKDWKKRVHLILPLVLLIYMIFRGYSLQYSAMLATALSIPLALIRPETRFKFSSLINALETSAIQSIAVTVPSAVAGIIVGVVTFSGIGMKFSTFLIQISGGNLYPTLFLVMLGCIVCGMAMPTTAAYIITAVLMAPALIDIGIAPIAAHMFVLYFAVLSMVTPPVALASYAGAGIAGADAMETGFQAWFLALNGFIVPYAFATNPALLLQGSITEGLFVFIAAVVGTYFIAKGLFTNKLTHVHKAGFVLAGILLIDTRLITDIVGLILGLLCLFILSKKEKELHAIAESKKANI